MGVKSRKFMMVPIIGLLLFQLAFCCSVAMGQTAAVSGIVTDAQSGETLPGVNVMIKGTTVGTSTDTEGRFELTAESLQDTLVLSFVGYQTQEVPINGRTEIEVTLQQETIAGEELVVIGYGTQARGDLTGSVESVGMESLEGQVITGANEALAGQIAGVQVNTTSGIPGGGPDINIRGVGAIGAGNSPLYVVDGYPLNTFGENSSQISNPLNSIPPSDIASISVLKGPSATAIYGSRASNGVVQITTKDGQSGDMNFQIDAYSGVQTIPNQLKPNMMNAREFASFMNEWIVDENRVTGSNIEIPEAYQNPSRYGEGTNWFEELTRVAPTHNFNFSASGGSEDIRSYVSANYVHQKGVTLGSDYNKIGLRANVNASISPKLEIGIRFSPSYSYGTLVDEGSRGRAGDTNADIGFFGLWEVLSPIEPVYNSDGTYNALVGGPRMLPYQNPVQGLNKVTNETKAARIIGTGYISYDIIDNVVLKTSFNADWQNRTNNLFRPSVIGRRGQEPPTIPIGVFSQGGYLNWANETNITYDNTFKGGHNLDVLGGISIQRHVANNGNFRGEQYPDDAIETLNAAALITGQTNIESWAMASFLGRLNYSYKNRYLLTATLRRDGSSKFGPENRWGNFPSVALGWRVSEEPWMSGKISWLSDLKLRGSYGVTGNDQIGNFSYSSLMGINDYVFGNSLAAGKTINSLGNSSLTWQETEEYNIGIDFGLFNNRISVTANYYKGALQNPLFSVLTFIFCMISVTSSNITFFEFLLQLLTFLASSLDSAQTHRIAYIDPSYQSFPELENEQSRDETANQ